MPGDFPKLKSVNLLPICIFLVVANVTASAANPPNQTSKVLDGMVFVGETGEQGKNANNPDTISFEGGVFRSTSCSGHGFGPAPYNVVKQGESYKFSTTLVSSDTGTLEWTGTITGGQASATFRWKHKRWFWNIERDYWYKGTMPSSQQ
jgi:hypothetical protein